MDSLKHWNSHMRRVSRVSAALLLVVLLLPACQKRCQAPATQAFKSLVETQWRLVETNDPEVSKTLDNFNFLIMSFSRNNTGQINRVVDNDQYDTPVLQMVWVPEPEQGLLRIQYSSVAASFEAVDTEAGSVAGDMGTFDYRYSLTGQLQMREVGRPYYYRYVPFTGIVDPDSVCSF